MAGITAPNAPPRGHELAPAATFSMQKTTATRIGLCHRKKVHSTFSRWLSAKRFVSGTFTSRLPASGSSAHFRCLRALARTKCLLRHPLRNKTNTSPSQASIAPSSNPTSRVLTIRSRINHAALHESSNVVDRE